MSTILGIDPGEKRIGLAIGSMESRLARPLCVIEHRSRREDITRIIEEVHLHEVTAIVIGASYQENGTLNSMGRHAVSFGNALQETCGLPVEYRDEALSTVDAKNISLTSGYSPKKRRGHQDALAATIILQSFFDSLDAA